MKIVLAAFLMTSLSGVGLATEDELTIPGEKWLAQFNGYVCSETVPAAQRPASLEGLDVQFEQITTDATLDNVLLKATFMEDGKLCRYNAVLLADNAAKTTVIVESKAFAPTLDSECAAGKDLLDNSLQQNSYLYYGHPHNVAIMLPVEDASALCGDGAESVGANFVVKGRISNF